MADADGPHRLLDSRRLRRVDKLFEQAEEIFGDAGDPEESIARFVQRAAGKKARLRKLAMAFAEGFFASHPERTSAEFIGRMARASAESSGEKMFRMLDGYDRLAASLARSRRAALSLLRLVIDMLGDHD